MPVRLHWDAQCKCSLNWEIGSDLKWKENHSFCSLCSQHIFPSKLAGMSVQALKKKKKKKAWEFISLCFTQGWVSANTAEGNVQCERTELWHSQAGSSESTAGHSLGVWCGCTLHTSVPTSLARYSNIPSWERERGLFARECCEDQMPAAFWGVYLSAILWENSVSVNILKLISDFRDILVMPQ